MIYKFGFLQIILYLFIAPYIRLSIYNFNFDYAWSISFLFLFSFLIGGILATYSASSRFKIIKEFNIKFSNFGMIIVCCWVIISLLISIRYGLYNRRIGTETAAELFANIPPLLLIVFRTLEISTPMLSAVILIKAFDKNDNHLGYQELCISFFLIISFIFLGAASSRSATVILFITTLVICQNRLDKKTLRKLINLGIIFGISIFSLVTYLRLETQNDYDLSNYISAEIFQRLDGLELTSEIVKLYGIQLFGVNPLAVFNPIISQLAFFEASVELKANALTSVKSVALAQELSSTLRDYNSFIVFDAYYLSGLLGVTCLGVGVGWVSKFIDRTIDLIGSRVFYMGIIAIAINLIVLEREAVSILMAIFRDWIILVTVSFFLFRHNL